MYPAERYTASQPYNTISLSSRPTSRRCPKAKHESSSPRRKLRLANEDEVWSECGNSPGTSCTMPCINADCPPRPRGPPSLPSYQSGVRSLQIALTRRWVAGVVVELLRRCHRASRSPPPDCTIPRVRGSANARPHGRTWNRVVFPSARCGEMAPGRSVQSLLMIPGRDQGVAEWSPENVGCWVLAGGYGRTGEGSCVPRYAGCQAPGTGS